MGKRKSGRRGRAQPLEQVLGDIGVALDEGDWDLALRLSREALALDPQEPELKRAEAAALRGLGRSEAALDVLHEALELSPESLDVHLDAVETLLDDLGDEVRALDHVRKAMRHLREAKERAELGLLKGVALARLDDFTGALRTLSEAGELDPENPEIPLEAGAVLIELLRFEDAESELRRALALGAEGPRAYQLLAFVLDYTGRREAAEEAFATAASLDPELPDRPVRLTESEFDAAVEDAVSQVPPQFAKHLENVEISVQNHPDREFCRRHDCGPMTLGIYIGTPMTLRENESRELPDRIVLFQRSLESACRSTQEVVHEIAVTLKHEIGHLLGMDEQQLVDSGYE